MRLHTFDRSLVSCPSCTETTIWAPILGTYKHFRICYDEDNKSRQNLPVYCWYIFSALWNINNFHFSCCFHEFTTDFHSAVTAPINGQCRSNYWAVEGAAQIKGKRMIEILRKFAAIWGETENHHSSSFFLLLFYKISFFDGNKPYTIKVYAQKMV